MFIHNNNYLSTNLSVNKKFSLKLKTHLAQINLKSLLPWKYSSIYLTVLFILLYHFTIFWFKEVGVADYAVFWSFLTLVLGWLAEVLFQKLAHVEKQVVMIIPALIVIWYHPTYAHTETLKLPLLHKTSQRYLFPRFLVGFHAIFTVTSTISENWLWFINFTAAPEPDITKSEKINKHRRK
jgi:hypothetical protein